MKSGRVNIVDVLIVLLVILAVAFVGRKFLPRAAAPGAPATPMQAVFISKPMPIWTPLMQHLTAGAPVEAVLGGTAFPFGTLKAAQLDPVLISTWDASGRLFSRPDPLKRAIELTIAVQARHGKGGYIVHNNPIYIGQYIVMDAGPVQLTGYIETFRP